MVASVKFCCWFYFRSCHLQACAALCCHELTTNPPAVCVLRLQRPILSCAKTRRRNQWKTTAQRPCPALLAETEMLPGVEVAESRPRLAPRRNPATSQWEIGPGPRVQRPNPTPRTPQSTLTGNASKREPITAQRQVAPL